MIIDLLRHGEAEGKASFRGHTDDPLTETGWQQMTSALESYQPATVISSPLKRCAAFAKQWADQHNLSPVIMPEFIEMNFGDWDGLTTEQIQQKDHSALNGFWKNPVKYSPPNGESLVDFQKRVVTGWETLLKNHRDQNVLLITHGGVIRMIMAHVLSMSLESIMSIESPLASMTRIRISFDEDNNHYASLVSHASILRTANE